MITWITAAAGGLYLVSIWLIEYDKEYQSAAATRLPPLVLAAHVTLAAGGLVVWVAYMVNNTHTLAWTAVLALVLAATLGLIMAIRWISVYRDVRALRQAAKAGTTPPGTSTQIALNAAASPVGWRRIATLGRGVEVGPPERNFPLPVVIGHGVFAVATLTLVLLIALGVYSS
ncbi:MAG: hypothetical protein J2P28_01240 [Actinobacteria bacterium]|nr:hypothetical protein [Actinomycetota bacterium]